MKLNISRISLVTLILAGSFSVSSLNARPYSGSLPGPKVKEGVTETRALDRKVELGGSVEKSEKPSKHELKRDYDIVLEKDAEGSLVGKSQRGVDIIRLDPKRGILKIGDMVGFGAIADAVAKQKGDDISISLSGVGERKDEESLRAICFAYGLSRDVDGNLRGKIQREKLKKLADELEAVETVGKKANPEDQSRMKVGFPVLGPSLTETLNNYIKSDKFKEDYRDRKYTYDVIYPFYKNYKDGYAWVSGKSDDLYDWQDGIKFYKNGKFFTMMDSNRGIMGFNSPWEARRIQGKLGETGIVPTEVYVINKDTYPLEVKWENEGVPFPGSEGGTANNSGKGIIAFDNAGYGGNQQFFGVVSFLRFNPEDFPRAQVQYAQYAQQEAVDMP